MLNNQNVFEQSLVNHLYFAGTIRNFCTVIGLTFFKNNQDYINRAIKLGYQATDITNKALSYMNALIAGEVLKSEVYITKYTKDINLLTEKLFDVNLKMQINEDLNVLKSRKEVNYDEVIDKIDKLNDEGMSLVESFKDFVEEIKNKLDTQLLFSYLYPDFFNYMYEEISVYGRDLKRIMSKKDYTKFYLGEFRYYFNELLRKSAEYIRGFLDTSHQDIFDMSSFYANAFGDLTEKYLKDNNTTLFDETERLVINYKNFVSSIIEKLLRSELYFITPPIVLDNFLTNINVYLFILKYARTI
jgi:hypothetical protein